MKKKYFLYFFIVILGALFLLPVYILILTSLKSFDEISLETMWSLPRLINVKSYIDAFNQLRPNFLNSLYLTVTATILSTMLGSLNGYLFSKWKFRGSNIIFSLFLFGMFIPYQSILIPLVQTLKYIGLYGTIWSLILTHVIYSIPLMSLIFRNYYSGVPKELIEAGELDGTNIFGIYRYILLPISIPAFIVAVVWQFTSVWNEFFFAIVLTQDPKIQPITVALANLAGSEFTEWNLQMAGALLVTIPPLLVYIFLGKYFLRGLLAGSVKG